METIHISADTVSIVSTSSKGDQSKWLIKEKWVKQNTRGYEDIAEYVASLILKSSTLDPSEYVLYEPCEIQFNNGQVTKGCYSLDFRGTEQQEVSLERLFETHFESTSDILENTKLSAKEKIEQIVEKVQLFTKLDIMLPLTRILAFDALILNEDRHTNNLLFLYDFKLDLWKFAPLFDHGLSLLSDVKDYPLGIDIDILKRKVKAKPFNTNFKKQLAIYEGQPFIHVEKLKKLLDGSPYDLGRAYNVIQMQLNDPAYEKLLIRGAKND
jgi:hypothetical protein